MRTRFAFAFLVLALFHAPDAHASAPKSLDIGKKTELWFAEDHTVPMITFVFSLPAGSAYDPANKPGLAQFAAAMIEEGAGNLDSEAFHNALANRAIRFSTRVERDDLVITVTTLSENAGAAMNLLSLALSRPRFDDEAVSRVRAQLFQNLKEQAGDPASIARKAFMEEFFNGHPYGHAVEGENAGIGAIGPSDLRAFSENHWVRGGLKIAVAGDIKPDALAQLLKTALAPLATMTPPPPPPVGRLGEPGIHVTAMAVSQPVATFGLPGIMRSDPDFVPATIANYILGGGGFSSRLMDEVRVRHGLAYAISTSLVPMRRASVMTGEVASRADMMRETIAVVRGALARLAADGPSEAELADAKSYLMGSFPLAFASNGGTADRLAAFQREGLGIDYVARRNSLIAAVTIDDVRRAAKRLFDPTHLTIAVAGTLAKSPPRHAP